MTYGILADDINHTCLYLMNAESAESAVRQFLAGEWHDEPEETWKETAAKASYLRFEVHQLRIKFPGAPNVLYPIFCSDDQAWEVEPKYINNHLAQRHTQLGMIYLSHKRWNEAVEEFLKASKLQQNGITKYGLSLQLAEAYIGQGNTDAAIEIYKTALARSDPKIDSSYDQALIGLAEIYRSRGDHATALPYYERYFELNLSEAAREGFNSEPLSEYEQDIIDYIAAHKM